jgi:probable O-glycosylation ligase (exosortase A-associated)
MPQSWWDRILKIGDYDKDGSAMGRINAWWYAFNAANDKLFGMGFDSWEPETFALYAPNPLDVHAAHSIYFSILADHGWIGLALYLLIYFMTWRKLVNIIKQTANNDELQQFHSLAKMLQVGFIAYFSGGAFLSLSYFDLPWHLVSIVLILHVILENKSLATNTRVKKVEVKSTRRNIQQPKLTRLVKEKT